MEIVTLQDYFTSSGKYPDRDKSPEKTVQVIENAKELLKRVNALLSELGITKVSVSSGFRTSTANAGIANAAKKSAHMTGEAIDLAGPEILAAKITKDLLVKHDLYREDTDYTKTWRHLQTRKTASGNRIFKP